MTIALFPVAQAPVAPGVAERLLFGGQIALVGLATVFSGLLVVWGVMALLPRLARRRAASAASAPAGTPAAPELTAEIAHAIALALFMDPRIFDEDVAKAITVKKLTQPFSPWVHSGKSITLTEKSFVFHRQRLP